MKKAKSKGGKPRRRAGAAAPGVVVLNGPNLNMLGFREPEIYGNDTLDDLENKLREAVGEAGSPVRLEFFQTNHEGEMIDLIQNLVLGPAQKGTLLGVLINPGGWTHTSVALRDALIMLKPIPLVEVHLSNPADREEFRHFSYIEDIVDYRVVGQGQDGYIEALRWVLAEMQKERLDVH